MATKEKKPKLTAKQERFIDEYLIDLNATQAAIRAGYSESTAKDIGCQNLAKLYISEEIEKRKQKRSEETKVTAAYVLKRLHEIDQMDVADILTDEGSIKPISEWPKVWRTSISAIDIAEMFEYQDGQKDLSGLLKKIKWPDKVRNLELLGKHTQVKAWDKELSDVDNIVLNLNYA